MRIPPRKCFHLREAKHSSVILAARVGNAVMRLTRPRDEGHETSSFKVSLKA